MVSQCPILTRRSGWARMVLYYCKICEFNANSAIKGSLSDNL